MLQSYLSAKVTYTSETLTGYQGTVKLKESEAEEDLAKVLPKGASWGSLLPPVLCFLLFTMGGFGACNVYHTE